MEKYNDAAEMLDILPYPAFCVTDGHITRVNAGAAGLNITPGTEVAGLLLTGAEEYAAFAGDCLYLTLSVSGAPMGASVSRMAHFDVFCLEELADNRELQALALAAREIRNPLETVMNTIKNLFPVAGIQDDPRALAQANQLNKGLFQLLRVINNMSDAGENTLGHQETVNICACLEEIFEKAAPLMAHAGAGLAYEGYPESIYCLADRDRLEQAILNILSNAVKFNPTGSVIRAVLTRRERKLYLSVTDNGPGIPPEIQKTAFSRYQRPCGIEPVQFGLGLGMVLIRTAAAAHGGAVLIDQPEGCGTRITMSLAIRQNTSQLRSPAVPMDCSSGLDPALLALSDILPDALYENEL